MTVSPNSDLMIIYRSLDWKSAVFFQKQQN